jgi:hypothetical protein
MPDLTYAQERAVARITHAAADLEIALAQAGASAAARKAVAAAVAAAVGAAIGEVKKQ